MVEGWIFFLIFIRVYYFFFFSSRRRHTRYWRDWSSDVCSSDLVDSSRVSMVKTQPWAHGYVNVINFRNDVGYLTDVGIVERYDVAMPYPGNLFVNLFYTEAPRGIVDIGLLAGLQHHLVVRLVAPHFYRTTYKAHRRCVFRSGVIVEFCA